MKTPTINLSKPVEIFESFKNDTPWYLKILTGFILGVIITAGVGYVVMTPSQPVAAAAPDQAEEVALQPTPTWTPVPTSTPAPPVPTPTPAPVYVIWSDQAEAVNMRDEPSGNVISAVANGQSVVVANEVEKSGGYTWVRVAVGNKEGWMANFLIWEMEGNYQLLAGAKDYYEAQNGAYVGTLPKGTPYKIISEEEGWAQILLPDEQVVWVEK